MAETGRLEPGPEIAVERSLIAPGALKARPVHHLQPDPVSTLCIPFEGKELAVNPVCKGSTKRDFSPLLDRDIDGFGPRRRRSKEQDGRKRDRRYGHHVPDVGGPAVWAMLARLFALGSSMSHERVVLQSKMLR